MWKKLFFAPRGRSDIRHTRKIDGEHLEIELPLVLLFVADLTRRPSSIPLAERAPVRIDRATFDAVLAAHDLSLSIDLPDKAPGREGQSRAVTLSFRALADMEPEALLAACPDLAGRLDDVLLHPRFRALESTWRGLRLAVDRIDFQDSVVVEILDCSKSDLHDELEDAPTPAESSFFRILHRAEDASLRLRPIAAVLADYEFSQAPADVALLRLCASAAELLHAPFLAAASPLFFGLKSFSEPLPEDPLEYLDRPFFTMFRGFRDQERARSTALLLPRVLLRAPLPGEPDRDDPALLCWGNPIYAFATRLADAFSRHRFCLDLTGPEGGVIKDLPTRWRLVAGQNHIDGPTEAPFSEDLAEALAGQGLTALVSRPEAREACFVTARSLKALPAFESAELSGQTPEDAAGDRLLCELPWLFFVTRFLHHLRLVHHEEGLGASSREEVERELRDWMGQWESESDIVSPIVATRRPLRKARVLVTEPSQGAPFFDLELQIRPHFRPERRPYCTLRVRTRLPRAAPRTALADLDMRRARPQ